VARSYEQGNEPSGFAKCAANFVLAGEISACEQGRCCVQLVNIRLRRQVDAAASRMVLHVPVLSACN